MKRIAKAARMAASLGAVLLLLVGSGGVVAFAEGQKKTERTKTEAKSIYYDAGHKTNGGTCSQRAGER